MSYRKDYAVGTPVLAINDNDEQTPGIIEAHVTTFGKVDAIIVKFDDGSRNEIGTEFLDEQIKSGLFVRKTVGV